MEGVLSSVPIDAAIVAVRAFVKGTRRHAPDIERRHTEHSFRDIQRSASEGNCYIDPEPDL